MKGKILITDTLFIGDKHVKQIEAAGYEVERLDKPNASTEELVAAVKGKVGYLLGGIEKVTDDVIKAADSMKAIVFTGSGWQGYIPGWQLATKKGIALGNVPDATNYGLAEYIVTLVMAMNRRIFELGRTGKVNFKTVDSLCDLTIGVIGLGRIGQQTAKMLQGLGAGRVIYWSQHRKQDAESVLGIDYFELDELLKTSDIVCLTVADQAGNNFLSKPQFELMKHDSLLVSISHKGIVDEAALYAYLKSGKLRAALEIEVGNELKSLPPEVVYFPNSMTGYNTHNVLNQASDAATNTIINLLETGEDKNLVNPDYRQPST